MKTVDTYKRAAAHRYYCMGLNSKEIGKLLDVSYRTVQNWMSTEKWKEGIIDAQPIHKKALELYQMGMSYNAIAERLGVSRSSAFQYVKLALKVTS